MKVMKEGSMHNILDDESMSSLAGETAKTK